MKNKVSLIGNVGNDPEIKVVGETSLATFSLATNETYKNKQGEKVVNTEWHNIVIWGGIAKVVEKFVKKGDKLSLEGKLKYETYGDDDNKKYVTKIVCNELIMLGSKSGAATAQNTKDADNFDDADDLPF